MFNNGIDFNDLPNWQKRGVGLYWEIFEKVGWNPTRAEKVVVKRREIKVDLEIPMGDEYDQFIQETLNKRR